MAQTNYQVLVRCLKELPPARRRNLGYHLSIGTRVIWNGNADLFADGKGGACVTLLAVTRDVPRRVVKSVNDRASWRATFRKLNTAADSMGKSFFQILHDSTEGQIRDAMREARL